MTQNIQLYQGDCLEVMKNIPDKSVDLVLTDPPYNIARDNNFTTMGEQELILESGTKVLICFPTLMNAQEY